MVRFLLATHSSLLLLLLLSHSTATLADLACQNAYIQHISSALTPSDFCTAISIFSNCASLAYATLPPADVTSLSNAVAAAVVSRDCRSIVQATAPAVRTRGSNLLLQTDPSKDVFLSRGGVNVSLWGAITTISSVASVGALSSDVSTTVASLSSALASTAVSFPSLLSSSLSSLSLSFSTSLSSSLSHAVAPLATSASVVTSLSSQSIAFLSSLSSAVQSLATTQALSSAISPLLPASSLPSALSTALSPYATLSALNSVGTLAASSPLALSSAIAPLATTASLSSALASLPSVVYVSSAIAGSASSLNALNMSDSAARASLLTTVLTAQASTANSLSSAMASSLASLSSSFSASIASLQSSFSVSQADLSATRASLTASQSDLVAARATITTLQSASSTYLTTSFAASQYLTASSAASQYLTTTAAAANYLNVSYANSAFLTFAVANATFATRTSVSPYGSSLNPGVHCKDILTKAPTNAGRDGIYYILLGGIFNTPVYCDMTTSGGGWTLVDYAYRATTGGESVYFLPNAFQGAWDPAARSNVASLSAVALLQSATTLILTVTNNGATPTTGNVLSYSAAYQWAKAASYTTFELPLSTTSCITVSVTDIKNAPSSPFNAMTFENRPQVSCAGHSGGTAYERQFLGFNSATCYGVCGADPTNSMGMVMWYGDGYKPTTSGGFGDPSRAASWGFWMR